MTSAVYITMGILCGASVFILVYTVRKLIELSNESPPHNPHDETNLTEENSTDE